MQKILFASSGMPEPAYIAASLAESAGLTGWDIYVACDNDRDMAQTAVNILQENNIRPTSTQVQPIERYQDVAFDAVVTFCKKSAKMCPTFPGLPARFHWPLDDMVDCDGNPTFKCVKTLVKELKTRVSGLYGHGTLNTMKDLRETFGAVIENLTDGILAHDPSRRIFVFNKAAEKITGYTAEDVVGQDCHTVFPGLFCGGQCSFCSQDSIENGNKIQYPSKFVSKSGSILDLEMSAIKLNSPNNKGKGSLIIFRDLTEVNQLKKHILQNKGFQGIVGQHPSMQSVYNSITDLSDENVPVLIQGESGVGKELVAEAIHNLSDRNKSPFVPVNCGALPEGVLESELFGHVKGSFTGAFKDRKGRFELADGGTLFLDEIGEITQSLQVKLLRALETKKFTPVGGEKEVTVDVRIVCATNRELLEMTRKGEFREDLYYRLAVYPIIVPPLRNRSEDIRLLIDHFLEAFRNETGRSAKGISPEAMKFLMNYNYPGNVRQLSNAIQYALIKCHGGLILPEHLPEEVTENSQVIISSKQGRPQKLTSEAVSVALQRAGGNRAKAARELGIARSTLYRYLESNHM